MSFDIYGQRLERGHCEVHPWVHEEYPCPVCLQESAKERYRRTEYDKAMTEQYDEYCREQLAEYIQDIFTTA